MNSAQHEQEQLHAIDALQRRLQQCHEEMEAIVHVVAAGMVVHQDTSGSLTCPYCAGDPEYVDSQPHRFKPRYKTHRFVHAADCIVMKARVLVEQAKEREQ